MSSQQIGVMDSPVAASSANSMQTSEFGRTLRPRLNHPDYAPRPITPPSPSDLVVYRYRSRRHSKSYQICGIYDIVPGDKTEGNPTFYMVDFGPGYDVTGDRCWVVLEKDLDADDLVRECLVRMHLKLPYDTVAATGRFFEDLALRSAGAQPPSRRRDTNRVPPRYTISDPVKYPSEPPPTYVETFPESHMEFTEPEPYDITVLPIDSPPSYVQTLVSSHNRTPQGPPPTYEMSVLHSTETHVGLTTLSVSPPLPSEWTRELVETGTLFGRIRTRPVRVPVPEPIPDDLPVSPCLTETPPINYPTRDGDASFDSEPPVSDDPIGNVTTDVRIRDSLRPSRPRFPPKKQQCQVCLKWFDSMGTLNRHHRTLHSLNPPVFLCPYCGRKFTRKEHLKHHVGRFHATSPAVTI